MAGEEKDRIRARLRELLIEARTSKGVKQSQLAKRLGRPQSYVSNYEKAERRIEVADFLLICRALEVDPSQLLSELIGYTSKTST
jgi:transcriptional regulator with XRE-family HTH domain